MDIAGNGSLSNGVHETSHGYDLWKNGPNKTITDFLNGETKAYKRQFSFSPNSLPVSYFGRARSLDDIIDKWIYGIQDSNNEFIYMNYVNLNMNKKSFLNFLKTP